jgi:hypothetical protein
VQKRFTRFPLVYGKVDLLSEPIPDVGYPFIEIKIYSYDKIPVLNHDNGLIFPDEKERMVGPPAGRTLLYAMRDGVTDDFSEKAENSDIVAISKLVTVVLYLEESGYQVYYRFIKERDCWFLFRVDDKST